MLVREATSNKATKLSNFVIEMKSISQKWGIKKAGVSVLLFVFATFFFTDFKKNIR